MNFFSGGPAALASDNAGAANIVYTRDATSVQTGLVFIIFLPLLHVSVDGSCFFLALSRLRSFFLSPPSLPFPNLHSSPRRVLELLERPSPVPHPQLLPLTALIIAFIFWLYISSIHTQTWILSLAFPYSWSYLLISIYYPDPFPSHLTSVGVSYRQQYPWIRRFALRHPRW